MFCATSSFSSSSSVSFKLQITVIHRNKRVLLLQTRLPFSHVFPRIHVLSCVRHIKFNAGHVQMQHDVRFQLGIVSSSILASTISLSRGMHSISTHAEDTGQMSIRVCLFTSRMGNEVRISARSNLRHKMAAVSLTHARHRTSPLRWFGRHPDTCLACISNTVLGCSVLARVALFW